MSIEFKEYDPGEFFDEMMVRKNRARPLAKELISLFRKMNDGEMSARQDAANLAIKEMGITFTVYSENEGMIDRNWPFDIVPRIIAKKEWDRVEAGLKQRVKALNLFIDDLYHDQKIIKDGVFPAEVLAESKNFRPQCVGVKPPQGIWAHICGSDLVRDADGTIYVLEDNLRVPSGVSYMLENRLVTKRVFPELFESYAPLPVDDYPTQLYETLASLSPRQTKRPSMAVLTPGIYNSAYFEHAYLAMEMGAELVEGRDLYVDDDDVVYMRTVSGPKRVDVIYRRIDDEFMDPEMFRDDSVLGVPGLMRAWKARKVGLANAPGAGVADDKVVYAFVPEIIRYYLNEEPGIPNVPTYRCMYPEERQYVLDHLADLVVKPANESGGYGMLIGPRSTKAERKTFHELITKNPRNYIAQPTLALSTVPTVIGPNLEPRHVDLRPFILSGRKTFVTTGGLTRVAMRKGSLVVNSSQGGGSKDTWIVDTESWEEVNMLSRVAENIYWLARYVERAENTARLVRVNSHLVLDTPSGIAPGWAPLVAITGLSSEFHSVEREANERNVVRFLIGDANNPGSIISSLAAARENCRTVRDVLPRSAWEKLNEVYLYAKENVQSGLTKGGRDAFLDEIITGSHQITGLLSSVMYRDEAFHFARIGRNLERADMSTRIIDVRSTDLFPDDLLELRSLDTLQWISVLRSLSAYQVYRRHVAIRVSRPDVLNFLFHDTMFPRSFAHCVMAVEESVDKLENAEKVLRLISGLNRKLRQIKFADMTQASLHEFIDELQISIMGIHATLAEDYFPPPIVLEESA